jgi:iron-sulfur cluster repair protein YtfE (RIC family)
MLAEQLTDDHRHCDDLFADAEAAANAGDVAKAAACFATFVEAMEAHLGGEEAILFPEFEAATGMTHGGPTAVMRMEHEQMRALLSRMQSAIGGNDLDDFLGLGETLNILIQQHNMKEEQMLYPMCDRALGERAAALCERLPGG